MPQVSEPKTPHGHWQVEAAGVDRLETETGTLSMAFKKWIVRLVCGITWLAACTLAQADLLSDERTEQVAVDNLAPITLRYQAFGPDRTAIPTSQFLDALAREMVRGTKSTVGGHSEGNFEFSSRLEVRVIPQRSELKFIYINRRTLRTNGTFIGQAISIPVSYQVREASDVVEITLTASETAELQTKTNLLAGTPMLRREAVFKDFANLLTNAPQMKLSFTEQVKGEATSAFKPDSVMGNFDRLMGKFNLGTAADRDPSRLEGSYVFLAGATRVPVKVLAYPYRDGTKLTYEARLPYVLRGDLSAEGMDQAAKLRSTIERVIGD